ncbi:MAG TPA: DoxX family protein [Bryobacteraceae bacterium]|nr:DoxX family protein [Bryobacteraceae bacterium]
MTAATFSSAMERPMIQSETTNLSKKRLWAGRILSGWAALFFVMDGGMKLFKPPVVVEATVQLGYPESAIIGIGVVLLACTILYLIPRTAVLGAVLLTGYLGGAVATHVRVSGSWFNILFPVVLGCFVWGGLWLRNSNVRRFFPLIDSSSGR